MGNILLKMKFFNLIALAALISSSEAIKIEKAYDGELPAHFDVSKNGDEYMGKIIKEYGEKDEKKGAFTVSKANALKYAHDVMLDKHSEVNEDDEKHLHTYWANGAVNADFEKTW